jgi:hypothetical protein
MQFSRILNDHRTRPDSQGVGARGFALVTRPRIPAAGSLPRLSNVGIFIRKVSKVGMGRDAATLIF